MLSVVFTIPGERGDARMSLILEQEHLNSLLSNNTKKKCFGFLSILAELLKSGMV